MALEVQDIKTLYQNNNLLMKDPLNIVFMGTPEFSVPILESINSNYNVLAVVTVPDKPQGRGRHEIPSPVKIKAVELGLPVLQPEKLKDEDFVQTIKDLNPDIIVVVAFRILPREVFTSAKIGTFNIHSSILPKFRGAAPINWAIIKGEKTTGLTTFLIDDKVDTGNVLLRDEFEIPEGFTAGDLHDFMMPRAVEIGMNTIELLKSGDYTPLKQDDSIATPAPKIFPENGIINWTLPAQEVIQMIHGFSPIPGARTRFNNQLLKIYRVRLNEEILVESGHFLINKSGFFAGCSDGAIQIMEFQPEGKKAISFKEFINGYRGAASGMFE